MMQMHVFMRICLEKETIYSKVLPKIGQNLKLFELCGKKFLIYITKIFFVKFTT